MFPILGRYGPFFLYSYQVIWGLGLVAGVALVFRLTRPPRRPSAWLDPLLAALVGGLLAGRAAFVWLEWDYFRLQPAEAWMIWRGGLSAPAALLGGLLALAGWCAWRGPAPGLLAGPLALLLPWLHATGWAACLLEGCAFGLPAAAGPLVAALPDSFGVVELRIATQALGIAFSLAVLLLAAWRLAAGARPTRLFWLTLALLAVGNAALAAWRGDGAPLVTAGGDAWRLDQLVYAGIALAALIPATLNRDPRPPDPRLAAG